MLNVNNSHKKVREKNSKGPSHSVSSHNDFWVMPYVWEQGMDILVTKIVEDVGHWFYVEIKSFILENNYKRSESRALE